MDDLVFELRNLCERNRDGSHSTRANRLRILTQVANELRALGFRHLHATSLKGKHIDALIANWQARRLSAGTIKGAGLSGMHGLRHAYAQSQYESLTGWKAPAAGGPAVESLDAIQRARDELARQTISQELGHNRIEITNVYLGR